MVLDKKSENHTPLRPVTNVARRTHGQTPRQCSRALKENLRHHPNAPRRPQLPPSSLTPVVFVKDAIAAVRLAAPAQVISKAVEPGSSEWEREKSRRMQEARAWFDAVKERRRRSLSTPPPPSPSAATPSP